MLSDDEKQKLQKRYEEDKYLRKLKRDDVTSNIADVLGDAVCQFMLFFAKLFPLTILKNKDIDSSFSKSTFELMASVTRLEYLKKKRIIFPKESEAIVEQQLLERSRKIKSIFQKILIIFVFAFFSILIINSFF